MSRRYYWTAKLIEGDEEAARAFCERENRDNTPYARRRYPATYHPHTIPDNYGPGLDWSGFLCWYVYAVG